MKFSLSLGPMCPLPSQQSLLIVREDNMVKEAESLLAIAAVQSDTGLSVVPAPCRASPCDCEYYQEQDLGSPSPYPSS